MPVLDVRHLVMLEAIAATTTLAAAARRLNITPSALTHRLQEAERRLACPLLHRSGRDIRLSDAGERLRRAARACLSELDTAEREAMSAGQSPRETVRLGASTLSGYEWLPLLLERLQPAPRQVDVEVVMEASIDPLRALAERTIDLAVVPVRVRGRGLAALRLFRDEMVALLPAAHPKSSQRFVDVRELATEVYVTDVTVPEPGREYERLFVPAGVRPTRVLRAGHMAAVVGLVRAGLGVTICTRTSAAPFVGAGGISILRLGQNGRFLSWYAVSRLTRARHTPERFVSEMLAAILH
jgi:LysR family transcriptional regulator for metE and metH